MPSVSHMCLTRIPIEVDPLTGEIDVGRTLYVLNPADAGALEMALRMRSRGDTVDRPHGRSGRSGGGVTGCDGRGSRSRIAPLG